jgi:hypothetical protein
MAKAAAPVQEPETMPVQEPDINQEQEGGTGPEMANPCLKMDPMQEMVKIKIPRDPVNKGNDSLFVAINGRKFLIQRGKTVQVPRAVAEVIAHSEEQAEEADLFIDANSEA